jgi:hypothetical protein
MQSSNESHVAAAKTAAKRKTSRLEELLHNNLHTDSEVEDDIPNQSSMSIEPWKIEFELFLATVEAELDGMDIIEW